MRKLIFFIQVFCFFLVSLNDSYGEWVPFGKSAEKKPNIKILSSDVTSIAFEISLTGMEIIEKNAENVKYHVLKIPDYYTTLEIGKPQLPAIRELIGVPDFSSYEISMLDSNVITLSNYNIYPFQKPLLEGELGKFTIDKSFYKSDLFYPIETVKIDKPSIMRDIRVSRISLFPFKFNPLTKEVKIYQKMVVKVNFNNVSGMSSPIINEGIIPDQWEKMYENSIINYSNLHLESKKYGNVNKMMSVGDYDYLVITHQNYFDAINKFASWKTRKGLLSKIVKLNDIGGNNQTSIKNYIISEYNNHHISYVLLVGDQSELCMSSTGPGDYDYSLLTGGINDYLPEIAIGRLSVTSVPEVEHAINKCIDYEMYLPSPNWTNNALLVAHKENAPNKYQGCSEEIRIFSYSDSPTFNTAYGASTSYGGDAATNSFVSAEINNGYNVVNYRGHGGYDCWWQWNTTNENYTTTNARALSNIVIKPIVFSIACSNSELDNSNETLAEAFMKTDNGATAFLGATRGSYTVANHTYDKELFKQTFNSSVNSIGVISNNAAEEIISMYGSTGSYNAKIYLWLGDPSTQIWTNTIQTFTNVQVTDNGGSITINTGTTGSDICVSSSNNVDNYYEIATNEASHTFTGITSADRPLYITITKHNYTPSVYVTSGTFNASQIWFGNMVVLGSISSGNGTSLTIEAGTNITFQNGSALIVDGTLNVNGTSSNKVTFDFQYPQNVPANGIRNQIKISPSATANITNAEIRNAYTGIYINQGSANIDNCLIRNGYSGILLYGTNNNPSNDTYITNTRIYEQTVGIDFYNSTFVHLSHNQIDHNYIALSTYSSSPYLAPDDYNSESVGYNNIHTNSFGLMANYNSNPWLGRVSCTSFGGNNTIDGNTMKDVNLTNNCQVYAENNWWNFTPISYVGTGCFF